MSDPVGIDTYCYLSHPTLGVYNLSLNRASLSIKISTSESRGEAIANIPAAALFEISGRLDGTGTLTLGLTTRYGIPDDAALQTSREFVFNAKDFDYAAGAKSSSVTVKGTKYITAVTPVARTLSRYISKDIQKIGADDRIVYAVPPLDIFAWNPGDTLPDGTIKSINYQFYSKSAAATLEVIA